MSISRISKCCWRLPQSRPSCRWPAIPAHAAQQDMVQLQTQVQQLQEQMTAMKTSFDERMGVMKNLVEQNTDAANKTTAAITGLLPDAADAAGRLGREGRPAIGPDPIVERHAR